MKLIDINTTNVSAETRAAYDFLNSFTRGARGVAVFEEKNSGRLSYGVGVAPYNTHARPINSFCQGFYTLEEALIRSAEKVRTGLGEGSRLWVYRADHAAIDRGKFMPVMIFEFNEASHAFVQDPTDEIFYAPRDQFADSVVIVEEAAISNSKPIPAPVAAVA